MVYGLLSSNGLCNYYELEQHPGLKQVRPIRRDKFAFLDDASVGGRLCSFSSDTLCIVTLYLPSVHCSSCMWLLEHLDRVDPGIRQSRINFGRKEITIHFDPGQVSLRRLAELLTTLGYEPYICLEDARERKTTRPYRARLYKLGVAGFCFANIMMMSFPEYLGGHDFEHRYALLLRGLNLLLALPVFFYCASEFFGTAWRGLRAGLLNIDAPIALAVLVTFVRSLYEILSGSGAGYLDSMSGIVFFMLAGRVVQERSQRSLSFHRDYRSYFPLAATVMGEKGWESRNLHLLREGDKVRLCSEELIPADSLVLEGTAHIDYSFVTGESEPVPVKQGERVYAGGRQTGGQLFLQVLKPVATSYLTSLWNHAAFRKDKAAEGNKNSRIHVVSRYFTLILFVLVGLTAAYWAWRDPSKVADSTTAMLIVACPCALLLAATYTNGHLLRLFSHNGLFLRDASVIEQLARAGHIVFDKTGTLTQSNGIDVCSDLLPCEEERRLLYTAASSSNHPNSRAIAEWLTGTAPYRVDSCNETAGAGVEAQISGKTVRIGHAAFTGAAPLPSASVYARIGERTFAFRIFPRLRPELPQIIGQLGKRYTLSLLSGDGPRQQEMMQQLFGHHNELCFRQQPEDKLLYVAKQQQQGHHVLMIGDGLNDAGALQQSDVGITLAEDINNFTPACDAILDARKFTQLPGMLRLARSGRVIIGTCFAASLLYNATGLWFAVQARMSPMIAAILMPASTLSIVLISSLMSWLSARHTFRN